MRRAAIGYLVATLPLAIAFFALPRYHLIFWGLLGWSAAAAVVVGVTRNRPRRRLPWLLVAAALATFVTGDVTYDLLTNLLGHRDPFPSVADVFYVATYPICACGLLGLVRARSRERNLGSLLDALIVAASCAIYLVEPHVRAADMGLFEKVVSLAYPLGDIAILCVLAWLVLSVDLRNWSMRLLTVGAVGLLVAVVLYANRQLTGEWRAGGPIDIGWVLFYVCWGAAALHPSMRALTEPQPRREKQLSMKALVLLSGAALIAPALLVWRAAPGGLGRDVGVIGVSAGVVFLLVMARVTTLARAQARQAGLERALRAVGESLVAASELEGVETAAVAAVESLVGPRLVACAVTVPAAPFERVVAAHPRALIGTELALDGTGAHDSSFRVRLSDGDQVPGTTRATQWSSFGFGTKGGAERRVVIGHRGQQSLRSAEVETALSAQLTLAADRVQLAEALHQRKNEARFRSLIGNVSDVILVVRADGHVYSETPSIEAVLGYGRDTAAPLSLADIVHGDDAPEALASIEAMLAGTHPGPMHREWQIRHADGRWLSMDVIGNDLSADTDVAGVVLTMRDVSQRKALEQQLRHDAFHDSLTKLANRSLFHERVDQALSRRSRLGTDISVLLLDIDDFKVVNDTLGHPAGDDLLVQFAERLVGCLRGQDTAARFGGDEFAVCIDGEATLPENAAAAQRILAAMAPPFRIAGTDCVAHVSIGISVAGDSTEGSSEMLREADLALYAAKNAGKGSFHFFEASLHRAVVARLERRAALEEAIEIDQLFLAYQPVVSLDDGAMAGVEALVRWDHPTLGLIQPDEFISLAEESGLVIPLGRWVLDQACADLSRWQRRWPVAASKPFTMAVNLSPRQLESPDLLTDVVDTRRRHDIDPSRLTFEITGSLGTSDSDELMTRLQSLHDLGIALALDAFGAGFNQLSFLHRLPIQILKIDASFVVDVDDPTRSDKRSSVILAIVAMATSLGVEVVAEGIERATQARRLRALGCAYGQGFHLGRPLPAVAIDPLIDLGADTRRREALVAWE
ncbi:MAG: EAL domain-containing protein [Acidimicrobiales bacterium]